MQILIDNEGFFTGNYSNMGVMFPQENQTSIEFDEIPAEQDLLKAKAYKWTGFSWEFVQSKYNELLNEEKAEQEKVRAENPSIQSLQSKVEYLSMMTGVSLDV